MLVPGEAWTTKELFVYPNEQIVWAAQIVLYPYLTGLVAGAFVLSSLYHVFGYKELKALAGFSLIFSFALLVAAPLPLLFHLHQPQRAFHVFFTPHFTSAIAAFGVVYFGYSALVVCEIWFANRKFIVESALALRNAASIGMRLKGFVYRLMTLGAYDLSEKALETDHKIIKVLAGIGIPLACFLHGYAGFIFGSVKANALWMTPLMPVIFIMSAIVSGIALCLFTYVIIMEVRLLAGRKNRYRTVNGTRVLAASKRETDLQAIRVMAKFLIFFMVVAVTLELLDIIFHGYTAKKHWDILRTVILQRYAFNIFVIQYGFGNLLPLILLALPGLTIRRAFVAAVLVLMGVFMMRWNVVIGGQAFSATFSGYMNYHFPIIPHDIESFKEGLAGVSILMIFPFILLWVLSKFFPLFPGGAQPVTHRGES
jgi:predicted membrane protein